MAAVTISNISDATQKALELRAARNRRSTEAEIRAILDEAVRTGPLGGLGTELAESSRQLGLTNSDIEAIELPRERSVPRPLDLE